MTDTIFDDIIHEGRKIRVIWRGAEFIPPRALVTQASGVCFTEDGRVVLVTKDGASWQLVGGHSRAGGEHRASICARGGGRNRCRGAGNALSGLPGGE